MRQILRYAAGIAAVGVLFILLVLALAGVILWDVFWVWIIWSNR